ncbi:MAG: hypothetical protein ACK4IX_06670, partial [Candidatus Sericytochromatia bacterium]
NALLTKNAVSNTAQGGAVAPTSAAAPLGAPEAVSSRGVAADSKMAAYPMMYFPTPGPFEEYTVVDFEESKLKGYSGTYLKTMSDIVKPLVAKLASDSRMVNSSGSTDVDGKTIANPSTSNQTGAEIYPVYNQYQWSFSFVSTSKKEVYSINVSSTETLVLKQKWGLRDLKIETIKIDSSDAVKILSDAIKNKKEVENEQKQYLDQNATVLYEIPKNASWYFYLEQEKGSLVWNVNMNIYDPQPIQDCAKPMPMPLAADTVTSSDGSVSSAGSTTAVAPCAYVPPAYYYSGAYARIDATTGKIIYFSRPIKWKNTYVPPVYDGPVTIQPAPAVVEGSSGGSDASK